MRRKEEDGGVASGRGRSSSSSSIDSRVSDADADAARTAACLVAYQGCSSKVLYNFELVHLTALN